MALRRCHLDHHAMRLSFAACLCQCSGDCSETMQSQTSHRDLFPADLDCSFPVQIWHCGRNEQHWSCHDHRSLHRAHLACCYVQASGQLHRRAMRPVNRCWLDDWGPQSEKQILASDLQQERYSDCLSPGNRSRQLYFYEQLNVSTYKLGLSSSVHVIFHKSSLLLQRRLCGCNTLACCRGQSI